MQVSTPLRHIIVDCICFSCRRILFPRWIPNNHIESTLVHNPIKLHKPVKRLMALLPLFILLFIVIFFWYVNAVNAILGSKIAIKFITKAGKLGTEALLALSYILVLKI